MLNIALVAVLVVATLLGSTIIVQVIASFRRRSGDMPPDLLDGDMPNDDAVSGLYLGTFREGWKKRLDPSGLLRKGPGKFWVDDKGVNFLVKHAFQPVFIPFPRIIGSSVEDVLLRKHLGSSALIVSWNMDGSSYRSAFIVDNVDYQTLMRRIEKDIHKQSNGNERVISQ